MAAYIDLIVGGALLVVLAAVTFGAVRRGRRGTDAETAARRDVLFATAAADAPNRVLELLTRAGRPIADTNLVRSQAESRAYASLRRRLVAGRTFSSSVEVYLATQLAALLLAAIVVLVAFATAAEGVVLFLAALIAAMLAYYPWDRVGRAARKRIDQVEAQLPDFAEMLVMPLTAGYTVLQAMQFVAEQMHGPVAATVKAMTARIDSRSVTVDEAFAQAADELGTTSARTLFESLRQADKSGVRVASALAAQATALRTEAYQQQRARNKKLPVQLVLIFAVHFLPLLLVVVLVPVILSLGQVA